ncbi:hypothetical protein [Lewinella sp. 4G2]|uniref:hypothetical protein n=1 Tax=Lewinella sp. 4G2 TaxID=1803372 RepID=UPI0007B49B55|nr:hypothetical protein [Lewinella sp. 4G2]OAV46018.1 hypothetical protein A3850_017245 [Lewinella sp. 4G2]
MPKQIKDQLWRLIKSLNKSEKRNFKLYANRLGAASERKFVSLFKAMDRAASEDDGAIREKLQLSAAGYSNLKRHLYQEVLTSLRLIHITKEVDIELREQIDFSRILYGKGLYLDALRVLERAKHRAIDHNQDLLHLEIVEFQKLIEARHVTLSRQIVNKMDLLLNESAMKSYSILNTSELLNMNIQVHGRYIERGHVRSEEEREENDRFWSEIQTVRIDRETVTSTFHQKINRFQAAMWYHYIELNFAESQQAAENASTLFTISRQMTVKDPDLYVRCLYYVTVFAYLNEEPKTMRRYRSRLGAFMDDEKIRFNENSRRIGAVYRKLSRYNELFLLKDYAAAYDFSRRIAEDYASGAFKPARHRWGLFLYKSAAAAFLLGKYDDAIDDLNEVINMKTGIHRQDLMINTRLLHALCNYELGHHSLVAYHLTSLSRLLRKSREAAEVHRATVLTLQRLISLPVAERGPQYLRLSQEVDRLKSDPFEAKALMYLDVTHWLAGYTHFTAPAAAPSSFK